MILDSQSRWLYNSFFFLILRYLWEESLYNDGQQFNLSTQIIAHKEVCLISAYLMKIIP
jgi:hypothetical protein